MVLASGPASNVRLYVGEPIQYESERETLRLVYEFLESQPGWAYLFSNINVSSRQLDLVVATENTTLVVEAKTFSLPVRGTMNGSWELLGPVRAKRIGNAYLQALGAKNALKTHMQSYSPEIGYPDAVVSIVPGILSGSELTKGDFKVGVDTVEKIGERLLQNNGCRWTKENWERFAHDLRLEPVNSLGAAISPQVFEAEKLISSYESAFLTFYQNDADKLVDDQYGKDEDTLSADDVLALVVHESQSVFVLGPSGCGKSLLAKNIAVASSRRGCFPILIAAKEFDGKLNHSIESEVSLLHSPSSREMVTAVKRLEASILLVVDGYNECQELLKTALTRSIAAFALRYDARIVVTSQVPLTRSDLIPLTKIFVRPPSDSLKVALAKVDPLDSRSAGSLSLLQLATTGLEAQLIGQVGKKISGTASRFALFDAYARAKLGEHASEGVRFLCALANIFVDRASFSLSIRDFDRLASAGHFHRDTIRQLEQSKLLEYRGDRISFIHELFYAAFTAEAAIRSANGDLAKLLVALRSPRFNAAKAFIVGGIEDERVLHQVLGAQTDSDIMLACSRGECGIEAKSWVEKRLADLFTKMMIEAKGVRFEFSDSGWQGVSVRKDTLLFETNEFNPYLPVIAQKLIEGTLITEVFSVLELMDATIAAARMELAAEAKIRNTPLRSALFADAYVMSRHTGISQLSSFIHSGGLSFIRQSNQKLEDTMRQAWSSARTPGQLYFLINVTKYTGKAAFTAPYIAPLLKNVKAQPYHLQLDLFDFVHYLTEVEEPWRSQIIESLEASLDQLGVMMNGIIFEALDRMGALEGAEYAHHEVVQHEISQVLGTDSIEADQTAWGIYSCQFDHPFSGAYWQVVQGLSPEEKKQFLIKACRGPEAPYVFFLGSLIQHLADFDDASVAPAIVRWSTLPDAKSFMPQDSVEVFVAAHSALGRLGVELPSNRGKATNSAAEAMLACGELYYWASRNDIANPATSDLSSKARSSLLKLADCAAAGALLLTSSWMLARDGSRPSLVLTFPDLSLAVCREALRNHEAQVSYHEHGFNSEVGRIAEFSIQIVGKYGDASDLSVLRTLCDNPAFGVNVLSAIRNIESRALLSK